MHNIPTSSLKRSYAAKTQKFMRLFRKPSVELKKRSVDDLHVDSKSLQRASSTKLNATSSLNDHSNADAHSVMRPYLSSTLTKRQRKSFWGSVGSMMGDRKRKTINSKENAEQSIEAKEEVHEMENGCKSVPILDVVSDDTREINTEPLLSIHPITLLYALGCRVGVSEIRSEWKNNCMADNQLSQPDSDEDTVEVHTNNESLVHDQSNWSWESGNSWTSDEDFDQNEQTAVADAQIINQNKPKEEGKFTTFKGLELLIIDNGDVLGIYEPIPSSDEDENSTNNRSGSASNTEKSFITASESDGIREYSPIYQGIHYLRPNLITAKELEFDALSVKCHASHFEIKDSEKLAPRSKLNFLPKSVVNICHSMKKKFLAVIH